MFTSIYSTLIGQLVYIYIKFIYESVVNSRLKLLYLYLYDIIFTSPILHIFAQLGDHDDRVVPLHSLKLIAQLQYKLGDKFGETPIMARIDTKSGHGAGKPTEKIVRFICFFLKIVIINISFI